LGMFSSKNHLAKKAVFQRQFLDCSMKRLQMILLYAERLVL
jgi:hypothetical protein